MRNLLVSMLILCAISCAKKSETSEASTDSLSTETVAAENAPVEIESAATESTEEAEPPPPWELFSYDPDLFISITLDSTILLLKSRAIAIDDVSAFTDEWDSLKTLSFDGSEMTYYRGDGGYYLHTGKITAKGFPFKRGVVMGMPRDEAIALLKIDPSRIVSSGDEDQFQHEWDMGGGSGDTKFYTFTFSKTNFISLTIEYHDMD